MRKTLASLLLGAAAIAFGAPGASAQTARVVVHDGPNILGLGTCASAPAQLAGVTAGWIGADAGIGVSAFGAGFGGAPSAGSGALTLTLPGPAGGGDRAQFININPGFAGQPIGLFASVPMFDFLYSHNEAATFGPGGQLSFFIDLGLGGVVIPPDIDEILIYQPALNACMAPLTSWIECGTFGGTFLKATGGSTTLAAFLAANAGANGGSGPLFPSAPTSPAIAVSAGPDPMGSFSGFAGAVDHVRISSPLLAVIPIPVPPGIVNEINFDFEADCSSYGGDADLDCRCDGPGPMGQIVVNLDTCPGDPINADTEMDGVCDSLDNCPADVNPTQDDADGDAQGDACDLCTDTDGDGFGNPGFPVNTCLDDNCPSVANVTQTDGDGDGLGDACDACPNDPANDVDGDGVCGDVDNCPADANPGQEDLDNDNLGNACDDTDKMMSLRRAQVNKSPTAGRDRWSGQAEIDVTDQPNFLDDALVSGIQMAIATINPMLDEINDEVFTGAECKRVGSKGSSLRCKNALGSTIRFQKRPAPGFFRVNFSIKNQSIPETVAQIFARTPLQVTITTGGNIDRWDIVDTCQSRGNRVVCKETP